MELTSQLSNIEEELKLLKGEIKSILKEIRTAVLSSDNPFTGNASAFKAPAAAAATDSGPVVEAPVASPEEASPFAPRPVELPLPAQAPQPMDAPFTEPLPLHSDAVSRDAPPEASTTSLFIIASLLSWAEDAMAVLGARRFRLMLELAYSAELLSPEVRDVLREMAEVWSTDNQPDRPVSVNECLLQLRQLEAIVNGEHVARIPRRRSRRRGA